MTVDGDSDSNFSNEDVPISEKRSKDEKDRELLTIIELQLAYSSEKVLNLDILLMHVTSRRNDYEALLVEHKTISSESMQKAFEFDILSGFLHSEVKEIDLFINYIQNEIVVARENSSLSLGIEMSVEKIGEKLHDAEGSLKCLQVQVSEIRTQLDSLERRMTLEVQDDFFAGNSDDRLSESDRGCFSHTDRKTQTIEQKRCTLQMLEKSLARELDLEKWLSDARRNEEEIRMRLHHIEHEPYYMEEGKEAILERLFEAENAAAVLQNISKELSEKLQLVQYNLNSSIFRETEMRIMIEQSMLKFFPAESVEQNMKASNADLNTLIEQVNALKDSLKEAEAKRSHADSTVLTLRDGIDSFEGQLTECNVQLQDAKASLAEGQEKQKILLAELAKRESMISDLKDKIYKAETRAESVESKCTYLTEANFELNKELCFLKGDGAEKASLLERKLEVSDAQLEHARVSVEAIAEQQSMLYSALGDMENLIEDLKKKNLKTEKRAESAESKCNLLTETNLELNEELNFMRNRLEFLETSLHQSHVTKIETAKDVTMRTKTITDIVMKLALERKRLQMQISTMKKENKFLMEKGRKTFNNEHTLSSHDKHFSGQEILNQESSEAAATKPSTLEFKVQNCVRAEIASESNATTSTVLVRDDSAADTNPAPERNTMATQLSFKNFVMAILVLFVSLLGVFFFSIRNLPIFSRILT